MEDKKDNTPPRKIAYVLDTNVLLHDPTSLFRFEEHDIYLPMIVLEELDGHKKGMTEVARNGRQTSRTLDALAAAQGADITTGLKLDTTGHREAGGRLFFVETDGGDFRDRIDADGNLIERISDRQPQRMAHGASAVFHRLGGQRGRPPRRPALRERRSRREHRRRSGDVRAPPRRGPLALDAAGWAAKPFLPLPVLGLPGWCVENESPAFYDDAAVFRPPRCSGDQPGRKPSIDR